MAKSAFPSELAFGTISGVSSRIAREKSMAQYMQRVRASSVQQNVFSGWTLSAGSGLTLNIASGSGFADGYYLESDATESITLPDASTNIKVFAQYTLVSNQITTWSFGSTTGAWPANSIMVGLVSTAAGVITAGSIQNAAVQAVNGYRSSYAGNNANDRKVFLGWEPRKVRIISTAYFSAPVAKIYSESGLVLGSLHGGTARSGDGNAITVPSGTSLFTRAFIPEIDVDGFFVSRSATNHSLNENGQTYQFEARA